MAKLRSALIVLVFVILNVSCATVSKTKTVIHPLSHRLTGSGKTPSVSVAPGDTIVFRISDTDDNCFRYNAETVDQRPDTEALRTPNTSVDLPPILHDEATTGYRIRVTKLADCTNPGGLQEVEWEVPVRELWNLAFAGGVSRHDLVDPQFYLEPGTGDHDKNSGTADVPGFYVRRNTAADDDFKIEGAALSHLYLSSTLFRGVGWSPLTFGLSIDDTRPSYLAGTSLRFGSRAFLTIGRIFGTRERLPTNLALNSFSPNANSLADLPTQAAESWFVGISYSFLSSGVVDLFRSRIGVPQGKPKKTGGDQGDVDGQGGQLITLDPKIGQTGTPVKITGKGFGGGSAETNSKLIIGAADPIASTTTSVISSWTDTEITFSVPAGFEPAEQPEKVTIEVKVGSTSKGKAALSIPQVASISLNPKAGKAGEKIKITGSGFGTRPTNGKLIVGTGTAPIASTDTVAIPRWVDTEIEFIVPAAFVGGDEPAKVPVDVRVGSTSKGKTELTIPKKP